MALAEAPFDLVDAKLAAPFRRPGTVAKASAIARLCASRSPLVTARSRRRWQQAPPICRQFLESTTRLQFQQMRRKKPRDVAVRREYRRCVRNVSARSTDRQQQSAYLQAL
jgi:hypothetical protein